jgi:hypothetical protein
MNYSQRKKEVCERLMCCQLTQKKRNERINSKILTGVGRYQEVSCIQECAQIINSEHKERDEHT